MGIDDMYRSQLGQTDQSILAIWTQEMCNTCLRAYALVQSHVLYFLSLHDLIYTGNHMCW